MNAKEVVECSRASFDCEIQRGERFRFGENWQRFLSVLDENRIAEAERSLTEMLHAPRLEGRSFLDIGSGSGLFSLAARRLGARVLSMDCDPASVSCTQNLKERFFCPSSPEWQIVRGSVLDRRFMSGLPRYDIVYSWGVLHHTGRMYEALENAVARVASGGMLYVALYRRTWLCPLWKVEKRLYCISPSWIQRALRASYQTTIGLAYRLTHPGRVPRRGMDAERDLHDWLGGYPYESITPRALNRFMEVRGLHRREQHIKSEGVAFTPGCDEYVFGNSHA